MSQQCKTQADCFRELARVAKMCEGTAANYTDCIKFNGHTSVCPAEDIEQGCCSPELVTAAVAIVEDKPVFFGSKLFDTTGIEYTVERARASEADFCDSPNEPVLYGRRGDLSFFCQLKNAKTFSWNPPKPKEPEILEDYTRHDGGACPVHGDTKEKAK